MKKKMKKLLIVIAIVTLVASIGYAAERYIPIGNIEGDKNPLPPRSEVTAGPCSVCWQVVYDEGRGILRPQIFAVNGGTASDITQEMVMSLKTIQPKITSAGSWQAFGFTCRPGGWKGFVDYAAAPQKMASSAPIDVPIVAKVAPAPAPVPPAVDPNLKAELDALKARLAAAEAAELKRLKDAEDASRARAAIAKPPVVRKPRPLMSNVLLTECKKNLNECNFSFETKTKELETASKELSTTKEKLAASEKNYGEEQKIANELRKKLGNSHSRNILIFAILIALIIGAIAGALLFPREKKRFTD